MKVFVTGGAGFIGSNVVDLLVENGYEVVIVDNLTSGRQSNLNPKAKFYQLDIRDPQLHEIFQHERPDFVSHHAAQVDVRKSVADPMHDASINVLGTLNVLEAARKVSVKRFIYISTGGAVYGEPEYLPCDENHPINPICQYGASKHLGEHYLYMYQVMYGMNYTVLRYPNVYGPRQDPHGEAGVVAIFTGRMVEGEPITINGDGEQSRDFLYVGDCARANLLALRVDHANGIYNLATSQATSINELYQTLKKITDYPLEAAYGPAKLGETRHIYLTADKAGQHLGWEQTVNLEEGLRRTVAHYKTHERAKASA
ncbi:MAG: NAD-dependent epimerase/dehydratase family protein [Anaerolineales bacterium]|nr:NAD-dependent epimerase/dehydratase family protein [Anaerolineales bacterium]